MVITIKRALTLVMALTALSTAVAAESMFNERTYQALVADQKAFKVGDALTVLIQESSAASSTVDSKADRTSELNVRGQTLGQQPRGLGGSVSSGGDGGGQTARTGRVTAQITANVVAVNENGELSVNGKQTVEVNGEAQIITVTGRVRPRDITDGNFVLSSRMADSNITYSGQGYLAEKGRPSIFSRFFTWIGL